MSFTIPEILFNIILIALFISNLIITFVIIRKPLDTIYKFLYLFLVWFLPFLGILIFFILDNFSSRKRKTIIQS